MHEYEYLRSVVPVESNTQSEMLNERVPNTSNILLFLSYSRLNGVRSNFVQASPMGRNPRQKLSQDVTRARKHSRRTGRLTVVAGKKKVKKKWRKSASGGHENSALLGSIRDCAEGQTEEYVCLVSVEVFECDCQR